MLTIDDTIRVIRDVLRLGDRANAFTAETALLGSLPEFDSMAVVALLTALEEQFGVSVADDEISGETFETVGSVHALVLAKLDA